MTAKDSPRLGRLILLRTEDVLAWLGAASLGAILVITSAEIFMRAVLSSPIRGVLDIVAYLMVATTFLPLAYVRRNGDLISVRILVDRLPERVRKANSRLTWLADIIITASLLAALATAAASYYSRGVTTAGAIDMPLYLIAALMVAGVGLLFIEVLFGSKAASPMEDDFGSGTEEPEVI